MSKHRPESDGSEMEGMQGIGKMEKGMRVRWDCAQREEHEEYGACVVDKQLGKQRGENLNRENRNKKKEKKRKEKRFTESREEEEGGRGRERA